MAGIRIKLALVVMGLLVFGFFSGHGLQNKPPASPPSTARFSATGTTGNVNTVRAIVKLDPQATDSIGSETFVDPAHGWVVAGHTILATNDGGTIYRTTDGGLTWQTVNRSKEQKNLYAWLSFVDDNTGFVGSGWGHLFVTHDGGRTLQVVDDKDSDSANFQFINSNVGWKTMDHHFYATTDAGQTWRMVPLDYLAVGFDMVSGDTVWAIAKRTLDSPPVLLSTSNGGQAWTLHDLENINPAGVVFADAEHGWLVDDHENYYHTGDGGQTWTQVDLLAH